MKKIYLVSSESLLYAFTFGRNINKGLILAHLQLMKYLNPFYQKMPY